MFFSLQIVVAKLWLIFFMNVLFGDQVMIDFLGLRVLLKVWWPTPD